MNPGDVIFYVLDAVILVMLIRMKRDSAKVEIEAYTGPKWVIPGMFWAIALLSAVNYRGTFRIIQTAVLAVFGVIYWFMKSGLAKDGVVMIGRLFPYEKTKPITFDEDRKAVNFTIRRGITTIFFPNEDMAKIRNYLCEHAGLPKKDVRRKESTSKDQA
jgi:hypothetical protein